MITKYPLKREDRNEIINQIINDPQFNLPKNSIIFNFIPHIEMWEYFDYNSYKTATTGKTAKKIYNSINIKEIFEFSNYVENYTSIKKLLNDNLPNYGYSLNILNNQILLKYKEKYSDRIVNSSLIPVNQKVYTSVKFKCGDKDYNKSKITSVYNAVDLNYDRMVIYKSINSEWGNDGYTAHYFYKSEKKYKKDLLKLNKQKIKHIVPKANYYNTLGKCERNKNFFNYSLIITEDFQVFIL